MKIVGLCGGSGSGKGEVARVFRECGIPVIDADEVYHDLLLPPSPCLAELVERFGNEILLPDGTLNRKALGGIVFSDAGALADLNQISHRYVMVKTEDELARLQKQGFSAAVFDAPQLFEAGAEARCRAVVSVLAPLDTRLARIMKRDGIDADAARKRIGAQKEDSFFRAHSDYVIENDGSIENLRPAVQRILKELGVFPL